MFGVNLRYAMALAALLASLLAVDAEQLSASFPGANGKIAFAGSRDVDFEIYVMNPDASGQIRLTHNPATDIDPAWAPEGRRIAFTSNRLENDDIYVMNEDGTGLVRLTTNPAKDVNPTWSPAGSIAFASTRDGNGEIYVMNADGSGQTRLTDNPASDSVPAWSPDGRRIAFASNRDGGYEIYVMNVDGSDQTRLTSASGDDKSPAWSPDGSRIAFASSRNGDYEIYVMNADSSGQTRLTRNVDIDLDPTWSPDGKLIAFTSNRDGSLEIYSMNADGTGQTRLTTNVSDDTTPDWQAGALPVEVVSEAHFRGRWRESEYRGVLLVTGEAPEQARLALVLSRGKRVYLSTSLDLAQGPFQQALSLPGGLLPGEYVLGVTASGDSIELAPQQIPVALEPPPEGVASRAWASTSIGGAPLTHLPPTTSIAFAHFRLAALPKPDRVLTVSWYGPDGKPVGSPVRRPRSALVISWVGTTNAVPLRNGVRRAVLRAGRTVVKRLTFRIG